MAKKKTAGPDNPTTTPANPRRRSAGRMGPSGTEAAPGGAAALDGGSGEAVGNTNTSRTIEAADDMAMTAGPLSGNGAGTYTPSYEEIAEAAYHRYLSRGGEHGMDFEDWLEAERHLRSRR